LIFARVLEADKENENRSCWRLFKWRNGRWMSR